MCVCVCVCEGDCQWGAEARGGVVFLEDQCREVQAGGGAGGLPVPDPQSDQVHRERREAPPLLPPTGERWSPFYSLYKNPYYNFNNLNLTIVASKPEVNIPISPQETSVPPKEPEAAEPPPPAPTRPAKQKAPKPPAPQPPAPITLSALPASISISSNPAPPAQCVLHSGRVGAVPEHPAIGQHHPGWDDLLQPHIKARQHPPPRGEGEGEGEGGGSSAQRRGQSHILSGELLNRHIWVSTVSTGQWRGPVLSSLWT